MPAAAAASGHRRDCRCETANYTAAVTISCSIIEASWAMGETVNLYEAKTNLSKLVDRAAAGEEIVIAKAGKPKVKLVSHRAAKSADSGKTCSELHIFPMVSTIPCRPSFRSISNRMRAAADRHAYPALGG